MELLIFQYPVIIPIRANNDPDAKAFGDPLRQPRHEKDTPFIFWIIGIGLHIDSAGRRPFYFYVVVAIRPALMQFPFFLIHFSSLGHSATHRLGARWIFFLLAGLAAGLPNLLSRFGGGEIDLFTKHGMTSIGYWVPDDPELSQNTLVYMLAHDSRQAAANSWKNFGADPDWQEMSAASQVDGRFLVRGGVQSMFLNPTEFSPAK